MPPDPPAPYPHLRALAQAAPNAAGVYLFYGPRRDLPLYIGKSVQLRSRLLSHLRNPDEARMLAQAEHIEVIRTAGEIGALLLEARLVKQRQPLFNRRLRRQRALCSLRWDRDSIEVVDTRQIDFSRDTRLYGLFATRRAAQERLRTLADEYGLCWGLLGLERMPRGRPCLRAMIGRCAGACHGALSLADHAQRLEAALAHMHLRCWPFGGAIGVVEDDGVLTQIHVVRNWCYLGSAADEDQARQLSRVDAGFDADGYKILVGPLLAGTARIVEWG